MSPVAGSGPTPTWAEGQDGTRVAYRERLWPAWWVWLVAVGLAAFLGIAYGSAYDPLLGWAIFLPLVAALAAALWLTAPVVRVDDRVFRAGRARLPLMYVGRVGELDPVQARDARGPRADPDAFLLLRTWAAARAVVVEVTDEQDPHPYWLVSSRHPDDLAVALRAASAGATGS